MGIVISFPGTGPMRVLLVLLGLAMAAATVPHTPAAPAMPDFPSGLPLMYPPYNYGMPVMPFYQNPWLMHVATGKTPQETFQLAPTTTMPNGAQNMMMGTAMTGAMLI